VIPPRRIPIDGFLETQNVPLKTACPGDVFLYLYFVWEKPHMRIYLFQHFAVVNGLTVAGSTAQFPEFALWVHASPNYQLAQ